EPLPAALTNHPNALEIQFHVLNRELTELICSEPGISEHTDDRGISNIDQAAPPTHREHCLDLRVAVWVRRDIIQRRRLQPLHWIVGDLALLQEPVEPRSEGDV